METATRAAIIVAITLIAGVIVGLVTIGGWPRETTAQIIDVNECQKACYAQESACTVECGTDVNPMECDSRCNHRRQDCLRQCQHHREAAKDEEERSLRSATGH